MKKSKLLLVILAVLLVFAMAAPALAEGEETDGPTETAPIEPTQEPTQAPTQEPTQAPTQEPTQAPTQEPTQAPTQEPTQAPTQAPPQDAGKVDITIYAYTEDNKPAEGYTVKIDETKLVAGKDGKVEFRDVTVEQHKIYLIDPDGVESVGVLYMSRGGVTVITDKAMGGKYGLDVAQGATHIYMNATFVPQGAIDISNVSESAPPQPAATASSGIVQNVAAKKLTALFLDGDGKAIKGMGVQVTPENGTPMLGMTNGSGEFILDSAEYGAYHWAVVPDGFSTDDAVSFELELTAGVQTGIAQSNGDGFVVNVAPAAKKVFLQFKQSGDRFVLEEVSESAIGGINSTLLGVIIVVVVVVVIIVIVSVNRKKKKSGYVKKTYQRESPAARMQDDAPARKTGGTNKFDDRSRM